jgi:hypothetical protein
MKGAAGVASPLISLLSDGFGLRSLPRKKDKVPESKVNRRAFFAEGVIILRQFPGSAVTKQARF